jgi:predicted Zn-dependent protease
MLRRLLAMRQRTPNDLTSFFASHPLEESRIEAAEREIATLPARTDYRKDSDAFRRLQERLRTP